MKKIKSALVISDNIIVLQEMKRMLANLEIKHVFEAYDSDSGLKSAKKYQPDYTFIDMDLGKNSSLKTLELIESKTSTRIILMEKKCVLKNEILTNSKYTLLEKPVTLNRLNDIVHPNLSFAALLQEARKLVKEESVATMFQI
ncbi:response regulator [Gracilimonas sp.]|uniref:response regulator n=1 Tax=Gracilimonas sp. TaxID=1974203 RepID=UPI0032EE6673